MCNVHAHPATVARPPVATVASVRGPLMSDLIEERLAIRTLFAAPGDEWEHWTCDDCWREVEDETAPCWWCLEVRHGFRLTAWEEDLLAGTLDVPEVDDADHPPVCWGCGAVAKSSSPIAGVPSCGSRECGWILDTEVATDRDAIDRRNAEYVAVLTMRAPVPVPTLPEPATPFAALLVRSIHHERTRRDAAAVAT